MLRLLHTADWHLGKRFPMFDDEGQKKLSRARMDVVGRILDAALRSGADAILCAGDLFDEPNPSKDFWEKLGSLLQKRAAAHPPVFMLPGNHDPLTAESVWSKGHPFRQMLPSWVHVVDRDDFCHPLSPEAVLYARPCRSKAGQEDPALLLPARESGDERVRIGMVHGSTFGVEGFQSNFPISREAGSLRGFDYLAIGDVHSYQDVNAQEPVPLVYPGAPEATAFDEPGAGNVAVVSILRGGLRPRVAAERVAQWNWLDKHCRDLGELRNLLTTRDLDRHVVRLKLSMTVTPAEQTEMERIVEELKGNDASYGRVGVLVVDTSEVRYRVGAEDFSTEDLSPVLQDVVARLERLVEEAPDAVQRDRALLARVHLFKLVQKEKTGVA